MKRFALLAASMAIAASAQAAPQYIFGFSSTTAANGFLVNGTTLIPFLDEGWYFQSGYHDTSNDNYIVGLCDNCALSGEYRNWFALNLARITTPVTSLALSLYSYDVTLTSGNYYLNDYTGSVSSLIAGTGGTAAFADLGSGVNFGYRFYQSSESNQQHTINLNSAAVASLNAAIAGSQGSWAIGGSFAPGTTPIPPVTAAVPEPETYALMLLGLGAVGTFVRRRRGN